MSDTEKGWVHHWITCYFPGCGHSAFWVSSRAVLWPDVSAWHSASSYQTLAPQIAPSSDPQCFLGKHGLDLPPLQEATETVFRDKGAPMSGEDVMSFLLPWKGDFSLLA